MIRGTIGMVHLGPLPGAAQPQPITATARAALADAKVLEEAGFDAILVENFGDAPFYPDDVPKVTVAAMSRIVAEIVAAASIPIGVNVLRNDAAAAVAVAAATGAEFIRVNVFSGVMHTDQGTLTGRAAEVARLKAELAPDLAILADVMVKHATPPPGLTIEQAAADLWERSGADGIIVSGSATGHPLDPAELAAVHKTVPNAPLYAGSGVNPDNVAMILGSCAGVIVGTALKVDGVTANPVDPERAATLVEAAP